MSNDLIPVADSRPDDSPWPVLTWPPPPGVVLTGNVVELRPADPDRDAEALFVALDDEALWRHVAGRPSDPDELTDALRARIELGWVTWIVRVREAYRGLAAGSIVGMSSYLDVAPSDARLEIGWTAYVTAVWSSAVNPDAKLTLLRYAFEELGAGRVQLKTDVRNARSQRAIAGLGAQHEATLRRYQRRADDTIRDTVLFSILAEEWPVVRANLQLRIARLTAL